MRQYKTCGKCGEKKLAQAFGKHKSHSDGLQPYCKRCNQEYLKAWYSENKLPHRADIRERTQKYKRAAYGFVLEYLSSNPCIDCGEDDPLVLDFDHRDQKTKKYNVAGLCATVTGTNLDKIKEEMQKCDVRCANCHRRKSAKQNNHMKYRLLQEKLAAL